MEYPRALSTPCEVDNMPGLQKVTIPFLLPHELFDVLAGVGKLQVGFSKSHVLNLHYATLILSNPCAPTAACSGASLSLVAGLDLKSGSSGSIFSNRKNGKTIQPDS
jgi:hypothetical protein